MVGSSTSGGTPLRRPIAIASASAAVCWNTSMLLRIFTTWPQPIGPQCVTSVPIVSSTGRMWANTASVAPTMMESSPRAAASRVRATGASA